MTWVTGSHGSWVTGSQNVTQFHVCCVDFGNQLTRSLITVRPNNRPMYAAKVVGSLSVSTEFSASAQNHRPTLPEPSLRGPSLPAPITRALE